MSLVMATVPSLRSFPVSRGCGTNDEIRRERESGAEEPLFVWSATAVIQNPLPGRYEPDGRRHRRTSRNVAEAPRPERFERSTRLRHARARPMLKPG